MVVGFDGDKAGMQAVVDGKIDATMVQQTQLMGTPGGRLRLDTASTASTCPPQQLQTAAC